MSTAATEATRTAAAAVLGRPDGGVLLRVQLGAKR